MRLLLAVPDEGPIAAELINDIQKFSFDGIRADVAEDHDMAWAQAQALAVVPECFPIFLLFGGTMLRDDGKPWEPEGMLDHTRDECRKLRDCGFATRELAIEWGNESDLAAKRWKKNPAELGALYKEAIGIVKSSSSSWHCLSPSISNLDEDSLEYLDRMELPVGSEVAFHRYPNGADFWNAQRGFRTRGDEVEALKKIANGAPLWNTETGWAEQNGDHTLSESEVASRLSDEIEFWNDVGVESLTIYQINSAVVYAGDDEDTKRLKTYGLRRADGVWKPSATIVKVTKDGLG